MQILKNSQKLKINNFLGTKVNRRINQKQIKTLSMPPSPPPISQTSPNSLSSSKPTCPPSSASEAALINSSTI